MFVAEQDTPTDGVSANLSLVDHIPVLSPLAWSMVFDYPVHQVGEAFRPEQPSEQPVCLVVYRNRKDKVAFLEANSVTARFLELCENNSERLGSDLLLQIAHELQHPDPSLVVNAGTEILAQLRQLDIIYGVSVES